jgi:hypothetical protein
MLSCGLKYQVGLQSTSAADLVLLLFLFMHMCLHEIEFQLDVFTWLQNISGAVLAAGLSHGQGRQARVAGCCFCGHVGVLFVTVVVVGRVLASAWLAPTAQMFTPNFTPEFVLLLGSHRRERQKCLICSLESEVAGRLAEPCLVAEVHT